MMTAIFGGGVEEAEEDAEGGSKMPATGTGAAESGGGSLVTFRPARDPFRTREVGEDEDEGLDEEYLRLAKELFGETEEKRQELLAELKEEIIRKGHRVPTRRAFLLKLLRAGNVPMLAFCTREKNYFLAGGFTVSGALEVLSSYVTLLNDCPQYFADTTAAQARAIGSQMAHTILRSRDKYGRRVFLYRAKHWNPDRFSFGQCFKLSYMLSELVALEPKTQVQFQMYDFPTCKHYEIPHSLGGRSYNHSRRLWLWSQALQELHSGRCQKCCKVCAGIHQRR